jgi:hypothetical protein
LIINESMSDYSGEDYEKVAIHTMLALSFLEEQKYDDARVEAKKINNKLHEITSAYDDQSKVHYKEDGFARFLSGLVYEAKRDWDDALIDYQTALALYEGQGYKSFYEGSVPSELVISLYGVAERRNRKEVMGRLEQNYPSYVSQYKKSKQDIKSGGDIVVIHETGHIVVKEAKEFIFPISGQIVRLSFPYIRQTSVDSMNKISGLNVGSNFIPASNVLNLNAVAYQSLEDRRGRLIIKNMVRLLAKAQLNYQAEKKFGPLGGIAANIFNAATETADTRGWTLLPQAFYISRVRVKSGDQSFSIKTAAKTTQAMSLKIEDGSLFLLRSKV